MTDNHTELCERLREGSSPRYIRCKAANLIESQAARIQQQAARIAELERKYKEAFDDCGELNTANHELLAACGEKDRRIAELEKERDALKADAERWREFAEHQTWCADCADSVSTCPIGSRLSEAALQAEKEKRS